VNANAAPLSIGGLFLHADIGRIVYVRADRAVSYASLIEVLGLVDRAGFGQVSLVAQADSLK
jgi:biopolymer transport protein ExbD